MLLVSESSASWQSGARSRSRASSACTASRSTDGTGVLRTPGGGSPVRILVVEDSAKMAGWLKKGLGREGYAVDVVGSGQDAIWMATENDYDAIVLDVILEQYAEPIDGFE